MWTNIQISMLLGLETRRYNEFPSDGSKDEFVVVREDGSRQGIFKQWAPPILPLLSGYEIDEWRQKAICDPAFLAHELNRALRNSQLIDWHLAKKFRHKLLKDGKSRIPQLVRRLKLAFSLTAPFYHLEAIVDDPSWLGINASMSASTSKGGELDVVAFLLPSALKPYVKAASGDWNRLDWQKIRSLTAQALIRPLCRIALEWVSQQTGVAAAEHIIFAANAMEFIPRRVAGKKDDFSQGEALERMVEIIQSSRINQTSECLGVLADINSKIRFLNWFPLIEGPENFEGRNWTYASVCDTTDQLFNTLDENPGLWRADFRDIYIGQLRPQILNLDATSARGRFLLDLIVNEGRIQCER